MKKFGVITLAVLLVGVSSCTRNEVLPGTSSGPVYKTVGTLDGEPFSMQAGVNGVELIPTFARANYGVYSFVGKFQAPGTNNEALSIAFNNLEQNWPGDEVFVEEVITESSKNFQSSLDVAYNVIELRSFGNEGLTHEWILNGEILESEESVIEEFEVTPGSELDLWLTVFDGEGCEDSLHLTIDQTFEPASPISYEFFTWEYLPSGMVRCQYEGDYSEVESIEWIAEGPVSQLVLAEGFSFEETLLESGMYELSMQVTLKNGVIF
ncbi:MAG: hypothetical protein HKN32_00165, partial [Flavobacteriales bacterium]|nr:hypothetical protein [Flavobacteriales bacterium]